MRRIILVLDSQLLALIVCRMITDLISETKATKEAIDSALDGVHEAEKLNEQAQMQSNAAPMFEADLFGFDSPAPAMESMPEQQSQPAVTAKVPATSAAASTEEEEDNHAQGMSHATHEAYTHAPAPAYGATVETVKSSSDDDDEEEGIMGSLPRPTFSSDGNHGLAASPSAAEVESIKEQARLAEQTAREAEETRRSLAQQADDLRKVAEQAESELHEKEAQTGHKKHLLRVGSKRRETVC